MRRHRLKKCPFHGENGEEAYEIADGSTLVILARARGETTWSLMAWPDVRNHLQYSRGGGYRRRVEARAAGEAWIARQKAAQKAREAAEKAQADLIAKLAEQGIVARPEERFGGYLPTPGAEGGAS